MMQQYNLTQRFARNNDGMILLITLTMLAVSSLLVLSALQSFFVFAKVSSQFISRHQQFYALETAGNLLIQGEKWRVADCIQSNKDFDASLQFLAAGKGCQFQALNQMYDYLFTDLGVYPDLCLNAASTTHPSRHMLLTVMNQQHEFLQLRLALLASQGQCQKQSKTIPEGVISWRYLPNL